MSGLESNTKGTSELCRRWEAGNLELIGAFLDGLSINATDPEEILDLGILESFVFYLWAAGVDIKQERQREAA